MNRTTSFPFDSILKKSIGFVLISVFILIASCSSDDNEIRPGDDSGENPEDSLATNPNDTITPGDGSFLLAEAHRVPAKMPMHLVYPRPDSETQQHARHRWAHSTMDYEIPIGIQGGAWPFKYEIVEGPSGASIGEVHGSPDYGNIKWKNPGSGTHHFKVKVTDQDLNVITADWDVSVDDNRFVFIQDGSNGSKTGSIDQPLEDFEDWYKNDRSDATYHNKIIVFREGNYAVKGSPDDNGNIRLDAGSKTPSLIAYPGESPILDCSTAKVFTDTGSLKDVFVAGLHWKDGRQDVNNAHFWWAIGDVSRATWWKNTWDNLGPGKVGNDNTTPVFISSTKEVKENILYKENRHDNINTVGSNGSYLDIYVCQYVLIEQNTAKNSTTNYGWWVKYGDTFVTVRANVAAENVNGNQITMGYSGSVLPHDVEVSWNHIKANMGNNESSLLWAGSTDYQDQHYNSYLYRNTFIGGTYWIRFKGRENYRVDGNVVISNAISPRWDTSIMTTEIENITGAMDNGIVDDTGKLQGGSRDQYFGTHGHEVPPPQE